MKKLFSGALNAATNIAKEQKNGFVNNLKTMATDAIQTGNIPSNPVGNLMENQMNTFKNQSSQIPVMGDLMHPAPKAPDTTSSAIVPAPDFPPIPMPMAAPSVEAPAAPEPISSPPAPAPQAPADDILSKMKHNIFSEEELNILKLMHINHLTKDTGEDVVNSKILGVIEKAIHNQLSTETGKQMIQKIILQNLPRLMANIVNFNGGTLAELIFKKTVGASNFRIYLTQTLEDYAFSKTPIRPSDLSTKIIQKIISPTHLEKEAYNTRINQIGRGISLGTGRPYSFNPHNVTRHRPRKHVTIL